MSSKKLRKYLAYYRKTLSDDPENIEARLRLAALFREMGRHRHAIEEYGTAAKLLASEGLPLEAIAACKAILELDATHRDTQYFLARLYAQVPEATDNSVRVARPVSPVSPVSPAPRSEKSTTGPTMAVNGRGTPADGDAITLEQPKAVRSEVMDGKSEAEQKTGDVTQVQPLHEQATLQQRTVDEEDDRQTFELDVFDMDSLELEHAKTGEWDELDILDEFDEPDTEELTVEERRTGSLEIEGSSPMKREFRVSALPVIPLFSQLPRKVFVEFLDAMELRRVPAGTEILRPDDPVSCLYVVVQGQVRVEKDLLDGRTIELASMGEGQVFGEFRLLTGRGGRARVVAETAVELLAVRDEVVYEVGRKYPELWQVLWSFYYRRMLNHAMASSQIFGSLSAEERELVMRHFEKREIEADKVIFARGERVDSLSLIVSGTVSVEVAVGKRSQQIESLSEGAMVGLGPCAEENRAKATARTQTDVVVYEMKGEIFRELIYALPEVAEAVREIVSMRHARTPNLPDDVSINDRV